MSNSIHFDAIRLETLISKWDEGTRLDFKKEVYRMDSDETKLKFARHLIAFANVARRIGKPCWIVFGVDDETRERHDVRDQWASKAKPKFWDNPTTALSKKQRDGVEESLRNVAREWIEPLPRFHLEYGELDGVFLSYLEIEPYYTSVPYRLTRKGSTYLVGTVFIRYGSQSLPVEPSQVEHLVAKSQAAYLTATDWANLVSWHKAGDFLMAQTLTPSFRHKIAGTGEDALDFVICALDEGKRRFVITAEAGHGKTVLLQRIAYTLAERHPEQLPNKTFAQPVESEERTVAPQIADLEVVPRVPVPLFMDLRMSFTNQREFERRLLRRVCEMAQQNEIESLDTLWKIPGSRWVVLLDGIDELRNAESAGETLRTWAESLPENVQVILTARPYAVGEWHGAENISLAQLTDAETLDLLRKHVQTRMLESPERDTLEEQVLARVAENQDLVALIRCPRALNGFLASVIDEYTPPKSQIDQDQVEAIASAPIALPEGQGPLPFAPVDPNLNDTETQQEERQETIEPDDDTRFVFTMPSLAISVQQIVRHMMDEEIKRHKGFGNSNADHIAANAQNELRRIAWLTDWDSESFDCFVCKEKRWLTERRLLWNKNIGFIRTANSETYYFYCALLRHYEAAARALKMGEHKIKQEFAKRKNSNGGKKILERLNELRKENGKDAIEIP